MSNPNTVNEHIGTLYELVSTLSTAVEKLVAHQRTVYKRLGEMELRLVELEGEN